MGNLQTGDFLLAVREVMLLQQVVHSVTWHHIYGHSIPNHQGLLHHTHVHQLQHSTNALVLVFPQAQVHLKLRFQLCA